MKYPEEVFRDLVKADTFQNVRRTFAELCVSLGVDPAKSEGQFYQNIKSRLRSNEADGLWKLLDQRAATPGVYREGAICRGNNVVIVGGGPCGLRMAIECALLGAHVVVLEMRDYIARNNVLHLWPFAIDDLRAIGAKIFHPKFCTGALHHVSIRRLQLILLKVALILGVQIQTPVKFDKLLPPNASTGSGWRVQTSPVIQEVHDMNVDVIVGADGTRNSLGFARKCMRGKLSIAITANLKRQGGRADSVLAEIPGVIPIKRPDLFGELQRLTGLEFENFVYFKDETHYFVMTAKKKGLIQAGILKRDHVDTRQLFAPDNVDRPRLLASVKQIARTAWEVENSSLSKFPEIEFAIDHHGNEDVAIFDFAALHQAESGCLGREVNGKRLLSCIVGDCLLEPFWPTGSGIARGFLGVLDAAWLVRNWCLGDRDPLEVLAERESTLRVLSQTAPDMHKRNRPCTLDPATRYQGMKLGTRLGTNAVSAKDVSHLYSKDDVKDTETLTASRGTEPPPQGYKRQLVRGGSIDTHRLLGWFKEKLRPYSGLVHITDLAKSWNDGLGLCALVEIYRPNTVKLNELNKNDARGNLKLAFELLDREMDVLPMLSVDQLAGNQNPNATVRLSMMSYLYYIYERIENESNIDMLAPEAMDLTGEDIPMAAFSKLRRVNSTGTLLKSLKKDADLLQSLDLSRLLRSKTSGAGLNFFLKTSTLDRHNKRRLHAAVRKTVSVRESRRTGSGSGSGAKVKAAATAAAAAAPSGEGGTQPTMAGNKFLDALMMMGSPSSPAPAPSSGGGTARPAANGVQPPVPAPRRSLERGGEEAPRVPPREPLTSKGVSFAQGTKTSDGISDQSQGLDQDMALKMMSLSRQACHGVAGNRIKLFQQDGEASAMRRPASPHLRRSPQVSPRGSPRGSPNRHGVFNFEETKRGGDGGKGMWDDQEGSTRTPVSDMAAKLDQRQLKIIEARKAAAPAGYDPQSGDFCVLCKRRLYLTDRDSAHGLAFHRACFRCGYCNTRLRTGNSVLMKDKDEQPAFYCFAHACYLGYFDSASSTLMKTREKIGDKTDLNQNKSDSGSRSGTLTTSGTLTKSGTLTSETDTLTRDGDTMLSNTGSDTLAPLTEDEIRQWLGSDEDTEGEDTEGEDTEGEEEGEKGAPSKTAAALTAAIKGLEYRDVIATLERKAKRSDKAEPDDASSDTTDTSLQLLAQDEIQRDFEDIEEEKDALEREGLELEKAIRGETKKGANETDDALLNDWLGVFRKKRQLVEKESRLMLQVKMMELQERQTRLQLLLGMLAASAEKEQAEAMVEEVAAMDAETTRMEDDVLQDDLIELADQLRDLQTFLKKSRPGQGTV